MTDTIIIENYEIDKKREIGRGTYGSVYKGKAKDSETSVAAKEVQTTKDDFGNAILQEFKILGQLGKHPAIVKMLDFQFKQMSFWLIMEFCEEGDLQKYCEENKPDIYFTIKIIREAASGLKFLHDNNIIHRDVKPGNILLQKQGDETKAKLTDFGFAKAGEKHMMGASWQLSTNVGTGAYKAPEFFAMEIMYTISIDVFALGLTLLALLQYEDGETDVFLPRSVESLREKSINNVGQEMAMKFRYTKQAPTPDEVVQIKSGDDNKTKGIKQLIQGMCAYKGVDRMTLDTVIESLTKLSGVTTIEEPVIPIEAAPREDLGLKFVNDAIEERFEKKIDELTDPETKEKARDLFKGFTFDEKLLFVAGIDMDSDEEIKQGDFVRVQSDRKTFEQQQKGFGGCTPKMKNILDKTGDVQQKILHVFKVQIDEETHFLNKDNLTLVRDEKALLSTYNTRKAQGLPLVNLHKGDIVRILGDEDKVKAKNKHAGGWNDQMRNCLGYTGIVRGIRSDGTVNIRCINGDIWVFNPDILQKQDLSKTEVQTADLVIVIDEVEQLQTLQIGFGGFDPKMERTTGKLGIVQEVYPLSGYEVAVNGERWHYDKNAVKLVAKAAEFMSALSKSGSSKISN